MLVLPKLESEGQLVRNLSPFNHEMTIEQTGSPSTASDANRAFSGQRAESDAHTAVERPGVADPF